MEDAADLRDGVTGTWVDGWLRSGVKRLSVL